MTSRSNSPIRKLTTTNLSTTSNNTSTQTSSPSFSKILATFSPPFLPGGSELFQTQSHDSIPTPISTSPKLYSEILTSTITTILPSSPTSLTSLTSLPQSNIESELNGIGSKVRLDSITNSGDSLKQDDEQTSTNESESINNSGKRTTRKSLGLSKSVFLNGGNGKTSAKDEEEEIVEDGVGKGRLVLEKYVLYETKLKYYVIASNQADSRYRVLKIDRSPPPPLRSRKELNPDVEDEESGTYGLEIIEDGTIYSKDEIRELLETLSAGNVGGITKVEALFYGIAGFIRFTGTYYMILIKARAPVALVGGHYIYHCEETILRPVSLPTGTKNVEESRLLAAFQGVDMSKNFYFSYTYDLTHTLQHNLTLPSPTPTSISEPPVDVFASFNDKWVWNRHILRPAFRGKLGKSPWLLPMIHGFVDQAKLSVFGRTVYITLIARRSRHFAGARFLKRGVNDRGYVANDVETEQIVSEALTTPFYSPNTNTRTGIKNVDSGRKLNSRYTSFVQVRGSIPLYWSQESVNMSPKPPIELTIVDPYFSAAALHFDDLLGRYGGPITILNLIKQKERAPRESKLLSEFKQCIDYLNQFMPLNQRLKYIPWDIAAANKQRDKDVIGFLEDIAEEALEDTNFFHSGPEPTWNSLNPDPDAPPYRSTPLLQSGVIRTNCIDCLDRTNAAQFVIAKAALGHQLLALGIIHHPVLPFDSDAVNLITEMFHDHGDTIALQYGGSHLVNTMETYRKIGMWSSHSRDMIENLRRYYANSFVDADKQTAIDLFLGIDGTPSAPHPTTQPQSKTKLIRRSYINWFTPSNLTTVTELEQVQKLLGETHLNEIENENENYWQFYYRPKLFTELARHFAFKVNSTDKYISTANGTEYVQSPFVPRLTAPAPTPRIVGGVRRWISHRGHNNNQSSNSLRTRIQSQRIDEKLIQSNQLSSSIPLLNNNTTTGNTNTENLITKLLNPIVELEELKEYKSYVNQFKSLSLGLELSEKDKFIYNSMANLARGSGGSGGGNENEFSNNDQGEIRISNISLKVDKNSLLIYNEAVKVSKTMELKY